MASLDSVRLALKPMSTMSLNERFQLLRQKQKQVRPQNAIGGANKSRALMRQGSQKNRRLALQMASRPSVLAALRSHNQNVPQKSRSIKQRLGTKRVANKSIPANQNRIQNKIGFKLNRNFNANNGMNRKRNVNQRNAVINPNNRRNANTQNIGVIVGLRRKGIQRNRLQRNLKTNPNAIGLKGKRKVGQQNRNPNQAKGVAKKRFRINRNFNNQAKPQRRRNVKPNKEQLDQDLDAYMAGTKSHLDAEIDAYMSQTN